MLDILKNKYQVGCANHYPAVWTWEAVADLGYSEESAACPMAAKACRQVFSLPIFPHTSRDDCEYVAWAVKQAICEAGGVRSLESIAVA